MSVRSSESIAELSVRSTESIAELSVGSSESIAELSVGSSRPIAESSDQVGVSVRPGGGSEAACFIGRELAGCERTATRPE